MSSAVGKTKISVVDYVNSLPLAWGILEGRQKDIFEPAFSMPAECADQLASGNVDIGLIPSIEYQRIPGCQIVPGPIIGSLNRVRSVLLISMVPLFRIRSVAYDNGSRASVVLAKVVLNKFCGVSPDFFPAKPNLEEMLAENDAALLIGDTALHYRAANMLPNAEKQREYLRDGAEPVQVFDLVERWNNLTGLPFVFALWATRKGFGDKSVVDHLVESRDFGLQRLELVAERCAERIGLSKDYLLQYLRRNVHYYMDTDCVEGLRVFYELAVEVGAIKSARSIQFL